MTRNLVQTQAQIIHDQTITLGSGKRSALHSADLYAQGAYYSDLIQGRLLNCYVVTRTPIRHEYCVFKAHVRCGGFKFDGESWAYFPPSESELGGYCCQERDRTYVADVIAGALGVARAA